MDSCRARQSSVGHPSFSGFDPAQPDPSGWVGPFLGRVGLGWAFPPSEKVGSDRVGL